MKTKEEQVVIGITCGRKENEAHFYLSQAYVEAVEEAGGLPVILPGCTSQEEMARLLCLIQGLILSGGGDVDPVHFGEEPLPGLGEIDPTRDIFELSFTRLALAAEIPVLGICRGMQILNISFGGSIYQDMVTQVKGCLEHYQKAPRWHPTHKVKNSGRHNFSPYFRRHQILGKQFPPPGSTSTSPWFYYFGFSS